MSNFKLKQKDKYKILIKENNKTKYESIGLEERSSLIENYEYLVDLEKELFLNKNYKNKRKLGIENVYLDTLIEDQCCIIYF